MCCAKDYIYVTKCLFKAVKKIKTRFLTLDLTKLARDFFYTANSEALITEVNDLVTVSRQSMVLLFYTLSISSDLGDTLFNPMFLYRWNGNKVDFPFVWLCISASEVMCGASRRSDGGTG